MKKFLTYAPASKPFRSGEYEELAILAYSLSSALTVKQKWYRIAGTTATYTSSVTVVGGRITVVMSTPVTETFTATSKVEVWAEYGGNVVTEVRTFTPDVSARKSVVRLGWLNTLGGIDHYSFRGSRNTQTFAEKQLYLRDLPAPVTAADRAQSVATSLAYDEVEVVSEFETEETYRWLAGIIASPEVWIAESDRVIPVIITTNSQPVEAENLFQFKLKYRLASDKIVQNG